jgi:hypothetical protein
MMECSLVCMLFHNLPLECQNLTEIIGNLPPGYEYWLTVEHLSQQSTMFTCDATLATLLLLYAFGGMDTDVVIPLFNDPFWHSQLCFGCLRTSLLLISCS